MITSVLWEQPEEGHRERKWVKSKPQMSNIALPLWELKMYYDYRIIDGYGAPIVVIVAKRGIGKTFGRVIRAIKRFKEYSRRFIYVVETEDMVDVLSQNRGEKFFSKVIEYLENQKSNKSKKLLNFISSAEIEETEKISSGAKSNIRGGTIYINGKTAGYIVSLNGFSKLKRNNFME